VRESINALSGTGLNVTVIQSVVGVKPDHYAIASGLTAGKEYYARVSAANSAGYGSYTTTDQGSGEGVVPYSHVARSVPAAPVVSTSVLSNSQIEVSFTEPSSSGSDIEMYKIEWTTDPDFASLPKDVRTIRLNSTNASDILGTFTIGYGGVYTTPLTVDSTPAQVEAALESLDTLGDVSVSVGDLLNNKAIGAPLKFVNSGKNTEWDVTFVQDVGVLGELTVDTTQLYSESTHGNIFADVKNATSGVAYPSHYGFDYMYADKATCGSTVIGSSSSVQKIVLRANDAAGGLSATVSAGSYQLELDGQRTACIGYADTAQQLKAALLLLPNVKNGVEVSSIDLEPKESGFSLEYTVYFGGEYPTGEWPTLRKVDESFGKAYSANTNAGGCTAWTGGSDHSLTVLPILEETACCGGVAETQAIVIDSSSNLGGSFDLYYGGESVTDISVSSTALQLEAKIAQFSSISSVSVTKHAHSDQSFGTAWVVTFTATPGDLEMLQIKDLKVIGTDANANVYPMINITTFADNADDIDGDFRVYLNGEMSAPISYRASQLKMVQTLEAMNGVGKVAMIGSPADDVAFNSNSSLLVDENFDMRKAFRIPGGAGTYAYAMGDLRSSVAVGDPITIGSCANFATIQNITFQPYMSDNDDGAEYLLGRDQVGHLIQRHKANFTDHAEELVESGKLADQGVTTIELSAAFTISCVGDSEGNKNLEMDGEGFFEAFIGKHVKSKTALPGLVSIQSLYSVLNTYPNNADASLRPIVYLQTGAVAGLSLSNSDKISIDGTLYTVQSVNAGSCGADCLTLTTDFTGSAITTGVPSMPVYSETVTGFTTADLSTSLVAGSIASISVSHGGYGVTSTPTVTISAPSDLAGVRATAVATSAVLDFNALAGTDGAGIALSTDIVTVSAALYALVETGSALVYTHGTSSTAIGGLTSGQIYYVIKLNAANTVNLADSLANAYAGSRVDLTAAQTDTDHSLKFEGVTSIMITNHGSGYTTTPTVTFSVGTNVAASVELLSQYVWVGEDKLLVSSFTANTVSLTGTVSYDNVGARMFAQGNGVEYAIAMKSHTADLDTLRVVPEGNWRGKNARIHVTRPNGKTPLTYVLGTPSEIQTVSLRDTAQNFATGISGSVELNSIGAGGAGYANVPTVVVSAPDSADGVQATATATVNAGAVNGITIVSPGSGYFTTPTLTIVENALDTITTLATATARVAPGSKGNFFTLTYNGAVTSAMNFGASAAAVEAQLESLNTIDQVTVERSGTGNTAGWNYGYIYTIAFWGTRPEGHVSLLQSNDDPVSEKAAGFSIHHAVVREGVSNAAFSSQYVALNENDAYAIRVSARNAEGFGPVSSSVSATTSDYGSLPSKPTSVVLGKYYTKDSLSLNYLPPFNNGGDDITKYKIEWDSSSAFETSSVNYGSDEISIAQEVQEISLYFRGGDAVTQRGGTFTMSWGGQTSGDLSWDISATNLEDEIAILTGVSGIAGSPIKVNKRTYGYGNKWKVTFKGGLIGNLGEIIVDDTDIVGDDVYMSVSEVTSGSADIYPGDFTYEVQTIYTDAQAPVSGKFSLSFEGLTTPELWFDSSAAVVKDALDSLGSIHTVNVVRSSLDATLKT
jgi:hypothetical protein